MNELKLSNQAVGAIMMLLQKAILNTLTESSDVNIVDILKEFELVSTGEGLVVKNPPVFLMSHFNGLDVDTDADTLELDSTQDSA